jgi:hypothetical protein
MKVLRGNSWSNQQGDGYEVSSQGDKRYSALFARLPDGRLIEDAWGQAKGYADGRAAKGKPALTKDFDYWGQYKGLWGQWAQANPGLMDELAQASQGQPLVDRFAKTENNQARALAELLAERSAAPAAAQARSGPLRLIIAGGRHFADIELLQRSIEGALRDYPLSQLRVVSGGAKGADRLGELWAGRNGVPVDVYPARWNDIDVPGAKIGTYKNGGGQYNVVAGFQRNDLMAENADAVLVMPGGSGTEHMVQAAKAKGLTVFDARGDQLVHSGPPLAMPEQPAAAASPTGQQTADGVQLDLWEKGKRFAGDAWPYLAAAGGAGLVGYAVADLMGRQSSGEEYRVMGG